MKINWGVGIVIAFVFFICFILFFIIKANTQKKYSYDLVAEEYYKEEINYQADIDKLNNVKALGIVIVIGRTEKGLEIKFPKEYQTAEITGKVAFYRPSNKNLDFEQALIFSSQATMLIPKQKMVSGKWELKLSWTKDNKEYLYREKIDY